ncbi:MAG: D-alanyl-D-alanine carboxypeptidase [Urechidicola sp.]|nr:D-alanyl-D-alanine carboxypeptidase [Urechidicola sp.]
MFKKVLFFFGFILILTGCKSAKITKEINNHLDTDFYENQFSGLLVVNPKTKDTIFNQNSDKYFSPASNTKIVTLFTALQVLPDSIPAFKYAVDKDTITILGTGDPSFLHNYFMDSTALNLAHNYAKVNILINNITDEKLGPGWAWEDYDTYFSPERSAFPMYGNVVTISNKDSLLVYPSIVKNKVQYSETERPRKLDKNEFYYNPKSKREREIPFVTDSTMIVKLWHELLPNKVTVKKYQGEKMEAIAYSIPSDSLYKRMMQKSDNHLAEQMLLLASSTLSDTLSSKNMRKFVLENQLGSLKQQPRWVDGSGLSRYNLFTPMSFVQILSKLYAEIPQERLFDIFPAGGESGTIKRYYHGKEAPYIYAKSGTFSNNYSLSGYLITNSGEVLIFSFMNNHYRKSSTEIKKQMQVVLEYLRDNY